MQRWVRKWWELHELGLAYLFARPNSIWQTVFFKLPVPRTVSRSTDFQSLTGFSAQEYVGNLVCNCNLITSEYARSG